MAGAEDGDGGDSWVRPLDEFVSTEESYVATLRTLCRVFVEPLRAYTARVRGDADALTVESADAIVTQAEHGGGEGEDGGGEGGAGPQGILTASKVAAAMTVLSAGGAGDLIGMGMGGDDGGGGLGATRLSPAGRLAGGVMHVALADQNLIMRCFANVEQLLMLHEELLKELQQASCATDWIAFAAAITKFSPFLKLYTVYVGDFEKRRGLIAELRNRDIRLDTFFRAAELQQECRGRDLLSLLICPVQRPPRYRLLLTEILKRLAKSKRRRRRSSIGRSASPKPHSPRTAAAMSSPRHGLIAQAAAQAAAQTAAATSENGATTAATSGASSVPALSTTADSATTSATSSVGTSPTAGMGIANDHNGSNKPPSSEGDVEAAAAAAALTPIGADTGTSTGAGGGLGSPRTPMSTRSAGGGGSGSTHPLIPHFQKALEAIENTTASIDANISLDDSYLRVVRLQDQLSYPLVTPSRRYLREGSLTKTYHGGAHRRLFILFSDALVYAVEPGLGRSGRVLELYPLRELWIVTACPADDKAFILASSAGHKKCFCVMASTSIERDLWIRAIGDARKRHLNQTSQLIRLAHDVDRQGAAPPEPTSILPRTFSSIFRRSTSTTTERRPSFSERQGPSIVWEDDGSLREELSTFTLWLPEHIVAMEERLARLATGEDGSNGAEAGQAGIRHSFAFGSDPTKTNRGDSNGGSMNNSNSNISFASKPVRVNVSPNATRSSNTEPDDTGVLQWQDFVWVREAVTAGAGREDRAGSTAGKRNSLGKSSGGTSGGLIFSRASSMYPSDSEPEETDTDTDKNAEEEDEHAEGLEMSCDDMGLDEEASDAFPDFVSPPGSARSLPRDPAMIAGESGRGAGSGAPQRRSLLGRPGALFTRQRSEPHLGLGRRPTTGGAQKTIGAHARPRGVSGPAAANSDITRSTTPSRLDLGRSRPGTRKPKQEPAAGSSLPNSLGPSPRTVSNALNKEMSSDDLTATMSQMRSPTLDGNCVSSVAEDAAGVSNDNDNGNDNDKDDDLVTPLPPSTTRAEADVASIQRNRMSLQLSKGGTLANNNSNTISEAEMGQLHRLLRAQRAGSDPAVDRQSPGSAPQAAIPAVSAAELRSPEPTAHGNGANRSRRQKRAQTVGGGRLGPSRGHQPRPSLTGAIARLFDKKHDQESGSTDGSSKDSSQGSKKQQRQRRKEEKERNSNRSRRGRGKRGSQTDSSSSAMPGSPNITRSAGSSLSSARGSTTGSARRSRRFLKSPVSLQQQQQQQHKQQKQQQQRLGNQQRPVLVTTRPALDPVQPLNEEFVSDADLDPLAEADGDDDARASELRGKALTAGSRCSDGEGNEELVVSDQDSDDGSRKGGGAITTANESTGEAGGRDTTPRHVRKPSDRAQTSVRPVKRSSPTGDLGTPRLNRASELRRLALQAQQRGSGSGGRRTSSSRRRESHQGREPHSARSPHSPGAASDLRRLSPLSPSRSGASNPQSRRQSRTGGSGRNVAVSGGDQLQQAGPWNRLSDPSATGSHPGQRTPQQSARRRSRGGPSQQVTQPRRISKDAQELSVGIRMSGRALSASTEGQITGGSSTSVASEDAQRRRVLEARKAAAQQDREKVRRRRERMEAGAMAANTPNYGDGPTPGIRTHSSSGRRSFSKYSPEMSPTRIPGSNTHSHRHSARGVPAGMQVRDTPLSTLSSAELGEETPLAPLPRLDLPSAVMGHGVRSTSSDDFSLPQGFAPEPSTDAIAERIGEDDGAERSGGSDGESVGKETGHDEPAHVAALAAVAAAADEASADAEPQSAVHVRNPLFKR